MAFEGSGEDVEKKKEALELYLETQKERRRKVKPDTTHIAELHVCV